MKLILVLIGFLMSMAFSDASLAQTTNFGDWNVGISTDKTSAFSATINTSGQIIAKRCTFAKKECTWHISTKEKCEKDESYPALVNTDNGSGQVTLVCEGQIDEDTDYRYVFSDWKAIENLILAGTRIGIAFPLQSDNFIVYRFSLKGSKIATEKLESAFFKLIDLKPQDRVKI